MALLGAEYASSDEGATPPPLSSKQKTAAASIVAAPDVLVDVWSHISTLLDSNSNTM